MDNIGQCKIGNLIFSNIDQNVYLNELYAKILYNYAVEQLNLNHPRKFVDFNISDALRFADLLSKSTHPKKESNTIS